MSDPAGKSDKPRPRRVGIVRALVAVGVVALLVNIVMPVVNHYRGQKLAYAAQRRCPSALSRLSLAITMHQNANAGAIPPDLDALQRAVQKEMGQHTWNVFTCPYATARGHGPCAHGVVCGTWYVYRVPPGVTNHSQIAHASRAVCAYEPLGNHDGLGMNILFWDGHVTWHDAAEARRIIAEVEAGHNPPREEMLK